MATDIVLPDQKVGDTWANGGGVFGPCTFKDIAGAPVSPPFVVTSCRLQFRRKWNKLVYEMSNDLTGDAKITIVDGALWHFTFPEQILPLQKGAHTWEFEVKGALPTEVLSPYSGTILMTEDRCFV